MRWICLPALAALLSCSQPCEHELSDVPAAVTATDAVFVDYEPTSCVPDQQAFDDVVLPVVQDKCGTCHGAEPAFGAPVGLVDYAQLVAGDPGNRDADRLARRASARTMPPPSSPPLEHDELDLLVEWATCGEVHPDHTVGLEVDRERYSAVVPQNTDLPYIDLTAGDFVIDRETLDLYQCFAFDVPFDKDQFIRRMQIVLDESRVLHHVVLIHDPDRVSAKDDSFKCFDWPEFETPFLWTWAPGTGAFDFAEGGLRIEPNDRLVVQIHYNNGAGLEDLTDDSGVRIHYGPAKGQEWLMKDIGPIYFEVPEGESVACDTTIVDEPMRILAGMPHMHELGAEFHQYVERKGQPTQQLVNLTGWNFEAQLFYEHDMLLEKGDKIHTWCGFRNESGKRARYGARTQDEMCYNFMFVGKP